MKIKSSFIIVAMLVLAMSGNLSAQSSLKIDDMAKKIPSDPSIIIGKLPNGLTYYIKQNKKPENRAELMLATKVGSVLEDDDQDGLAHFCEHMAFNGTKNFPKANLVNYLESIGVKFGADLNAFTNQDETVYMLQLPTDKSDQFEQGMNVIRDWAGNVLYENTEIDKERGVILEEWRLGKGAEDRVQKKHMPVFYYNSKYAQRDVIGDTAVLLRAPYANFTRFYKDWYRPNLMAVIAVGDFDLKEVERMIIAKFGNLTNPANERPRTQFPVPPTSGTMVSIATDKELRMPMIQILMKASAIKRGDYNEYRTNIVRGIFSTMLSKRFQEKSRKPDAPFVMAQGVVTKFSWDNDAFMLFAIPKGDKINDCIKVFSEEINRVKQFGFTQTEFDRTKNEMLRNMEQGVKEKDKTESQNYAFEYMRNFNNDEAIPGIEMEYELYKKWMPEISLKEVGAITNEFIKNDNNIIAISAPEKEGIVVPSKEDVLKLFGSGATAKLTAYVDEVSSTPLMSKKLTPGTVKKEKIIKQLDVTEWTLSNGVKVVFKKTDYKNDEIMMRAFSPGGYSNYGEKEFDNVTVAASVIDQSGIGKMNADKLEKLLSGQVVSVSPSISGLNEGFSGNASPKDLETMFQLIYLYFTDARVDADAFKAFQSSTISLLQNQSNSPEAVFRDSINYFSKNYHYSARPNNAERVKALDQDKIFDLYYDRFADASDFTFFFVGNIDNDKFKNFVLTYLANLPVKARKESWKDMGVGLRAGVHVKEVKKGIEKKSSVRLIFNGDLVWNDKEVFNLHATMEILNIKLREVLREDKGGVYGVGAFAMPSKFPKKKYQIQVMFGCNPDRVEELISAVIDQMKDMQVKLPTDSNMVKVKEMTKREYEVNLKENNFWLNALYQTYWNQENPLSILDEPKLVGALKPKDIQNTAKKYFKMDNYMKFVLYPEK
jgi:zinc protease